MFTLSKNDFSNLHNAKSYLLHEVDVLENVLAPAKISRLKRVLEYLNEGMVELYKQEDLEYRAWSNLIGGMQQEWKLISWWATDYVDDFNHESNFTCLVMEYQGNRCSIERTDPDKNPTWLDLWRAADQLIVASKDLHHSFIESFVERKGIIHLETGS